MTKENAIKAVTAIRQLLGGVQYNRCHGCGLLGGYDVFGLPTKCPTCGSREVWPADAG